MPRRANLGAALRILLSDYSGHPFQIQLSRWLAGMGHELLHVSSASFQTPKGKIERAGSDPETFRSVTVRNREPFAKSSFIKRRRQEQEIGDRIAEHIRDWRPDIVVSSNAPLDAQKKIQIGARAAGSRFVFWVQDLYSEAMLKILPRRFGLPGRLVGHAYRRLESRLLRNSEHAIVISPDFKSSVAQMSGMPASRISVIENWAPLEDISLHERDNDWARSNLPESPFRLLYSGTLGYKHNPQLLLKLARSIDGDVIVFSEGDAVEALQRQAEAEGVSNLRIQGWLPFDRLPNALAAADVLIVLLEPDAGSFSVPSKVLTYMCAGRPILGSIPSVNLSARLIGENAAGIAVESGDDEGFLAAARALSADPDRRRMLGRNARSYAERAFDIAAISGRFEAIFADLVRKGSKRNA